ncbi:MAG: hypothetical protein MJA30_02570 [Cytophagales bacterium]|nr:hypothetical protein [Cytophagales bacterium]
MSQNYHYPLPRDDAKNPIQAIKKVQDSSLEHLYIFKKDQQIRRFMGETNQVTPPPQYLFELKDAVIVHNHPSGSSFSWEDVRNIIYYDAFACYLVTNTFVYYLVRPQKGWEIDVESKRFEKAYNSCHSIAEDSLNKMIALNEISEYEREAEIIHYIWMLFFKINSIEYGRKKVNAFKGPIKRH